MYELGLITPVKMSVRRGALIILEGVDRSGKSTQCRKLVKTLQEQGEKVHLMRFPDRTTKIGKVINEYLSQKCELEDHAIHLLFSANRWEALPKIKELIHSGTTVVIDRYAYSGVAFTAAKPGFQIDWCKICDSGLPRPDLVLFLKISIEDAANRAGFGGERYEKTDFQAEVSKNYELLRDNDWRTVEAGRSIEEVHEDIKQLTMKAMAACANQPLGKLWTTL
ncbi:thymidylate kinase-like [Anneissia japonica]|uniref:thymidylate kinase-like n=1 Tax=Anneissia japonica TaxID=1529436 RepID=UPI0014256465|nr:thymidylate kinase-like [Anneissia japonica]